MLAVGLWTAVSGVVVDWMNLESPVVIVVSDVM
jgi:hypothetical protein